MNDESPASDEPPAPDDGWTVLDWIEDFQDPHQEWRRLFAEFYGTFLLVLAAAGAAMMSQAFPGTISRQAAVVAPGLMVMGVILFMGKVSGAHLNPAVSIGFALRDDFPWRRVPGYVVVQLAGAALACVFLQAVIGVSASYGSTYPAAGYSASAAFSMEAVLTLGLVSVILGTASGAQNIGLFGAFAVGGYIALAGLWGSPISGASMNPARTFGPDLVGANFGDYWVYVAGRWSAPSSRSASRSCSAVTAAAVRVRRPRRAACSPRSTVRESCSDGADAGIRSLGSAAYGGIAGRDRRRGRRGDRHRGCADHERVGRTRDALRPHRHPGTG